MTNFKKIAIAIAALSATQAASAVTLSQEAGLETAIEAIGSAYMTFGASSTAYADTLGDLQDLVEAASQHGTYEDGEVTFTINNDGTVDYTSNVTTYDNSTAITNAHTALVDQIETDFYGAADNDLSDISITKSGGVWDMTAGSVLTTWGDCTYASGTQDCNNIDGNNSSGIINELNDLETALGAASNGGFTSAQLTALDTAISNLDDSIDVIEAGFTDIGDGLADDAAGQSATADNWDIGRTSTNLDLSETDYEVQLNGVAESDQIVTYYLDNATNASAITIGSTTYGDLDNFVCEVFTGADC